MFFLPTGNRGRLGLILVYTGNGKGKTCASVGQAMRALGQGMTVTFAQFIKRPDIAGEQKILSQLLGMNYRAGGIGFCNAKSEKHLHTKAARELLIWVGNHPAQMTVLDESIYALNYGLFEKSDILPLLDKTAGPSSHLVLSGRDAPLWLRNMAHIVTEMCSVKHIHDNGASAMPGIEF